MLRSYSTPSRIKNRFIDDNPPTFRKILRSISPRVSENPLISARIFSPNSHRIGRKGGREGRRQGRGKQCQLQLESYQGVAIKTDEYICELGSKGQSTCISNPRFFNTPEKKSIVIMHHRASKAREIEKERESASSTTLCVHV